MTSAFLVFDLVGRNAIPDRECNTRGLFHPKRREVRNRLGLPSEKRVSRVPAARASPNATGRIRVNFLTGRWLLTIRRSAY
jgi:hypothetical protein